MSLLDEGNKIDCSCEGKNPSCINCEGKGYYYERFSNGKLKILSRANYKQKRLSLKSDDNHLPLNYGKTRKKGKKKYYFFNEEQLEIFRNEDEEHKIKDNKSGAISYGKSYFRGLSKTEICRLIITALIDGQKLIISTRKQEQLNSQILSLTRERMIALYNYVKNNELYSANLIQILQRQTYRF